MKSFFAGLGIGAVLGVLFAPNRGKVTRQTVRDRVTRLVAECRQQVGNGKDVVKTTMDASAIELHEKHQYADTGFPKAGQAREVHIGSDPINTLSCRDGA